VAQLKQEVATLERLQRETDARRTEEAQLASWPATYACCSVVSPRLGDVPEALARADAGGARLHERLSWSSARRRRTEGWVRERQYARRAHRLLKQYEEVKEQRDQIVKLGPEGRVHL